MSALKRRPSARSRWPWHASISSVATGLGGQRKLATELGGALTGSVGRFGLATAAAQSVALSARTSATALGRFGLRDEPLVDPLLEASPEIFTGHPGNVAGTAWLDPHGDDGRVVIAVATGVALGFRQRPEAPHGQSV